MVNQIEFSKRYIYKLEKVYRYIAKEWSEKIAFQFIQKVHRKYEVLIQYPFIGRPSTKKRDVYSINIAKHNKIYYRIKRSVILMIDLRDTRMNPNKNPY